MTKRLTVASNRRMVEENYAKLSMHDLLYQQENLLERYAFFEKNSERTKIFI